MFDEVLPSIRRSGGYLAGQDMLTDEELLSRAMMVAQKQIEQRDLRIKELEPKAQFADAVSGSPDSVTIGTLAKLLKQNGVNIGRNRLYTWLRVNGYLNRRGDERNLPSQIGMNRGLFEIKETVPYRKDGENRLYKTALVTTHGQQYFLDRKHQIAASMSIT